MEINSKKLKVRNLPAEREVIDQINSKPYIFIIFFLVAGVYLICTKMYLFGFLLTALFLYNLIFIKNQIDTEFYMDYIVFYNKNDREECYILFYKDIKEWRYIRGRFDTDMLEVTFMDNKKVKFSSLSKGKMLKHMRDHAYKLEMKAKTNTKKKKTR